MLDSQTQSRGREEYWHKQYICTGVPLLYIQDYLFYVYRSTSSLYTGVPLSTYKEVPFSIHIEVFLLYIHDYLFYIYNNTCSIYTVLPVHFI